MRVKGKHYRTVWMEEGTVKLIDQRILPFEFKILSLDTPEKVAEAIRDMTIRGAGAIGAAAGFGMALAALQAPDENFDEALNKAAQILRAARPTAQNPFYAIDRILRGTAMEQTPGHKRQRAQNIAQAIADEDASGCERIGEIGLSVMGESTNVLTHCNAGWLAFADWGSALSPIYQAKRKGRKVFVYAAETRPRSQGAKLTSWELGEEGIPHKLIPDTATGSLMRQGLVDLVIVGADRVAANGDVANKIGTYTLAVLAKTHSIPFYVAVPTTTIDMNCASGADIPIEERNEDEVLWVTGRADDGRTTRVRIAPDETHAINWAFDVTPASYITGLITERGRIDANVEAIRTLSRDETTAVKG